MFAGPIYHNVSCTYIILKLLNNFSSANIKIHVFVLRKVAILVPNKEKTSMSETLGFVKAMFIRLQFVLTSRICGAYNTPLVPDLVVTAAVSGLESLLHYLEVDLTRYVFEKENQPLGAHS